jgi:hypothetical protein
MLGEPAQCAPPALAPATRIAAAVGYRDATSLSRGSLALVQRSARVEAANSKQNQQGRMSHWRGLGCKPNAVAIPWQSATWSIDMPYHAWQFSATESLDGDSYIGAVVTASPTTYVQGESISGLPVMNGGSWAYTITSGRSLTAVAPGDPQTLAAAGQVVVFEYFTASGYEISPTSEIDALFLGTSTVDGTQGLGSESDSVAFNGSGSTLSSNSSAFVNFGRAVNPGLATAVSSPLQQVGLMAELPGTNAIDYLQISGSSLQSSDTVAPYTSFNVVADGGIGDNLFGQYNGYGNSLVTQGDGGQIDFMTLDQQGNLTASGLMNGSYWDVHGSVPVGLPNFTAPSGTDTPALISQSQAGQIDLLWFDYPNGTALQDSLLLDGNYWNAVATGNVTGDGHADIVTQNSTSGQIDFLTGFNGSALTQSALASGSFWPVKGTADLDHNGHPWLISQDPGSGQVDLLKFSGGTLVASDLLAQPLPPIVSGSQVASNFWKIF